MNPTEPIHHNLPLNRAPKRKSVNRWRFIFFLLALAFAIAAFFSWRTAAMPEGGNAYAERPSVLESLASWLSGIGRKSIAKNDRVNILILGQGGTGHEGPYLTDTIIVLSLKPKSGDAVILSIPRDLAVPVPDVGLRKINEVNAIGEVREKDGGAAFAADVIGNTLGVPIAGYVRVDFTGFKELVDIVDGIEVDVVHAFSDPLYPDDAGSVRTVSFAAGRQQMEGETALIYVRSRHGTNGEGSDFARAHRQQQVMLALRERLINRSTLFSPGKIADIIRSLDRNVKTNIPLHQFDDLLALAHKTQGRSVAARVLDSSPDGVLSDQIGLDGAYLLVPKDGDYGMLAAYVQGLFNHEDIRLETARIAVLNGTSELGRARKAASELEAIGAIIVTAANAPSRNWHESVLFDLTGMKPSTVEYLQQNINARIIDASPPEEIMNMSTGNGVGEVDIILILGKE